MAWGIRLSPVGEKGSARHRAEDDKKLRQVIFIDMGVWGE